MKSFTKKNTLIQQIEQKHGEEIEEILRRLFVDEDMSVMGMAQYLGISYVTCQQWLKHAGIRHRRVHLGD
jgi:predicted HTH domain antitoxin